MTGDIVAAKGIGGFAVGIYTAISGLYMIQKKMKRDP